MNEKTITDFLSDEYKSFAFYTIESRAIPSLIDGLKISQKKVINACREIWKTGKEKHLKVFQLSGVVAHTQFYHHGNASLDSAIINLAQKFKNNLPLLEEDGQFGSLRSPQAGAPRYIGTKLSPIFPYVFRDFNLLKYKEEEGEKIEPEYFLPIVPTILINGGQGIAVGFASNILNRDISEVIEACKRHLIGKNINIIKPHLNVFTGDYIQDKENPKKWYMRGKFQILNKSTVQVTELPPGLTYEKYEEILDRLVESKEIVSYEDNCKDNIDYIIKFTRADLEKYDNEKLIKLLKLEESETENFTLLDEFCKLKIFENAEDIIRYFVDFRLKFYKIRKDDMINRVDKELSILFNRGKFIKSILMNKLIVNNKSKSEIIEQLESLSIDKIDGEYDYLLRMPIHSLTKEMFEKMKIDFKEKTNELERLKSIDPKNMYLEDLEDLKKNLKLQK